MTFEALSPDDFEDLVGDLLGADRRCSFERFARGADGGVDLRSTDSGGRTTIVQCKHYERSSVDTLVSAARKEANRQLQLDGDVTYIFATSKPISDARKAEITVLLSAGLGVPVETIGGDDLRALIRRFPEVERSHVKLWISSGQHLTTILNSATEFYTESSLSQLEEEVSRFVATNSFRTASKHLEQSHGLLISGPPGVGKTTAARMLVRGYIAEGFTPFSLSEDAREAESVFSIDQKQIFLYDDFLGTNILREALGKNEDKRLSTLFRRCQGSPNHRIVLTTREYLLQEAAAQYETFTQDGILLSKHLITLSDYGRYDRASIFASHILHSPQITENAAKVILAPYRLEWIINHGNYSPRLIQYVTGRGPIGLDADALDNFDNFVVSSFNHPEGLWDHAFNQGIDDDARHFVLTVASFGRPTPASEVRRHYRKLVTQAKIAPARPMQDLLAQLEESFVSASYNGEAVISLANPGMNDSVVLWLRDRIDSIVSIIRSSITLVQLSWIVRNVCPSVPDEDLPEITAELWNKLIDIWDSRPTSILNRRSILDSWSTWRIELALDVLDISEKDARKREFVAAAVGNLPNQIEHEPFFPERAANLVLRCARYEIPAQTLAEAALRMCIRESIHSESWEAIRTIVLLFPEQRSLRLRAVLAESCGEWANYELENELENMGDPDEVEDIVELAAFFGATIDADLVDLARRRLNLDEVVSQEKEIVKPPAPPDRRAEDARIHAMVAHVIQEKQEGGTARAEGHERALLNAIFGIR